MSMLEKTTVKKIYAKNCTTEFRLVNRTIYWVCVAMCHHSFAKKINFFRWKVFS